MPRRRSSLQVAYTNLVKTKAGVCNGKKTKTQARAAAKRYVAQAVKQGQTKTEATRKANKVLNRGCGVGSKKKGK